MTRYTRNPAVHAKSIGDDLFLVDESDQAIYHLNTLGGAFWTLLAQPTTLAEAYTVFTQAFPDHAPDAIRADLETLAADLVGLKLIE